MTRFRTSLRLATSFTIAFVLAATLLASHALAEDQSGTFVASASYWHVTPRGLGLDYAFIDESGGLSGGGRIQSLDFDAEGTQKLGIGWRFGGPGAPSLGATFWEIDAEARDQTPETSQGVGALLASPDFAIGRSLVDQASARASLRATVIDLALTWTPLTGERGRLELALGARGFRFEQQETVTYRVTQFGLPFEEIVNTRSETRGVGPLASLGFSYGLTSRARIAGRFGVAYPVGEREARVSDSAFVDGSFDRATVVERPGTTEGSLQLEGELRVELALTSRLEAHVGYAYMHWPDVSVTDRFVDDVSQNSSVSGDQSATMEGLFAALRFAF